MTTPTTDKPVAEKRIPTSLGKNAILADFCRQYLAVLDEIAGYNKEVLAEKDSDWNAGKVLEKARGFARPTDKDVKPNDEIKTALETWENLVNEMNRARKAVLDMTSKELGITLSATADRNPELEAPMKDRRKFAVEIGTQLGKIADMTTDEKASEAVESFLKDNPLPAIGRDQVHTFGASEATTPKYRVQVVVTNAEGEEKVNEAGFTKAALALTKFYEKGKAPKSDTLRDAWEKAGNNAKATVTNPVEFDDNELHYVITKK